MAHGDARETKWRGNWRMKWVASTLHTTSEHGVSNITTADPHTSAASSRLNSCPRRFKWTRPFRRKTKSGFCACAITVQLASTYTYWQTVAVHWIQCLLFGWNRVVSWTLKSAILNFDCHFHFQFLQLNAQTGGHGYLHIFSSRDPQIFHKCGSHI